MSEELQAGIIGNGEIAALVHRGGRIHWACMPRLDGDPVFHSLLGEAEGRGAWDIELKGQTAAEQRYLPNTAVLVTTLRDADGNAVEIHDFCPRFVARGRQFRPAMLVRRGTPTTCGGCCRCVVDRVCGCGCGPPAPTVPKHRNVPAATITSVSWGQIRYCGLPAM